MTAVLHETVRIPDLPPSSDDALGPRPLDHAIREAFDRSPGRQTDAERFRLDADTLHGPDVTEPETSVATAGPLPLLSALQSQPRIERISPGRAFLEARSPVAPDQRVVNVTIGRIEVRAVPATSRPVPAASASAPRMTLEDYLRKIGGAAR